MPQLSLEDFERVEIRVGTVVRAEEFPDARKPAYKLWIDLGDIGIKTSSAQLTRLYRTEELVGRQVLCVTDFPPKQVGRFVSEILTTGFVVEDGNVMLAQPERGFPTARSWLDTPDGYENARRDSRRRLRCCHHPLDGSIRRR